MAESKDAKSKVLTVARPKKLSLTKTVEGGKVTQNFSRGVSKTVAVEVRKTRTFSRGTGGGMSEDTGAAERLKSLKAEGDSELSNARSKKDIKDIGGNVNAKKGVIVKKPSKEAAPEASPASAEKPVSTPSKNAGYEIGNVGGIRSKRAPKVLGSPSSSVKKRGVVTAPTKEKPVSEAKPAATTNNRMSAAQKFAASPDAAKAGISPSPARKEEENRNKKMRLKGGDTRRQSNKLTVSQALDFQDERMRSLASVKRRREKMKRLSGDSNDVKEKIVRDVVVPENITVQELANRMAERMADITKALMKLGTMATGSQVIDADTAELIIEEFGHKIKRVTESDVENILVEEPDNEADMKPRAPVITVMGHVDHGKTSLLDALRNADVVKGEAGGITQHIGAYQVKTGNQKITFLDTPGHEAFTAMRSRGAAVTDIVVLVVAADDGIKAQTIEAINHAKSSEVPIIVAINKMDKPAADPARVKNELMQHELVAEEFGGEVQVIEVSAIAKTGLDTLVEALALQAEMMELKANPSRKASGVVVEAHMEKGRGAIATLLVQKGSLKVGDIVVAGSSWGRARALVNENGQKLKKAIPSQPLEILGLDFAPLAGDEFDVVENEKTARDITEYRMRREKDRRNIVAAKTLDQLFSEAREGEHKNLDLIIKGDVQGSVEAIIASISKFNNEEVSVKILHSGVGAVNESDTSLSYATGAIILGFNVRATVNAREFAENEKIDIRYYSVIYNLIDDINSALSGMLSPDLRENLLGYAEIREVFNITKVGKVAGCMVTEGGIKRGAKVRLLRDNVVIHEGTLKTLKRFKEEVKDVKSGQECGMAFEKYDDIRAGDMIEAFEIEEISRTVESVAIEEAKAAKIKAKEKAAEEAKLAEEAELAELEALEAEETSEAEEKPAKK